jgi:hypothetical protein
VKDAPRLFEVVRLAKAVGCVEASLRRGEEIESEVAEVRKTLAARNEGLEGSVGNPSSAADGEMGEMRKGTEGGEEGVIEADLMAFETE